VKGDEWTENFHDRVQASMVTVFKLGYVICNSFTGLLVSQGEFRCTQSVRHKFLTLDTNLCNSSYCVPI